MDDSPGNFRETARRIFRELAGSYDQTVDYATMFQDRKWKRWVQEVLGGLGGGLVLDVGCGTLLMEQRTSALPFKFVGLDISERMIREGQRKVLGNVQLIVEGDAEVLPFPDETFDAVVSCYVAKYVDLDVFASELSRVCKTGGVVAVYDFARPSGALAPLLELYVQAGLRGVAFAARLSGSESAFTFQELPRIVDGAEWHTRVRRVMEGGGFDTSDLRKMAGGIVYAYAGTKKG